MTREASVEALSGRVKHLSCLTARLRLCVMGCECESIGCIVLVLSLLSRWSLLVGVGAVARTNYGLCSHCVLMLAWHTAQYFGRLDWVSCMNTVRVWSRPQAQRQGEGTALTAGQTPLKRPTATETN